jgi:hypothetical protein
VESPDHRLEGMWEIMRMSLSEDVGVGEEGVEVELGVEVEVEGVGKRLIR